MRSLLWVACCESLVVNRLLWVACNEELAMRILQHIACGKSRPDSTDCSLRMACHSTAISIISTPSLSADHFPWLTYNFGSSSDQTLWWFVDGYLYHCSTISVGNFLFAILKGILGTLVATLHQRLQRRSSSRETLSKWISPYCNRRTENHLLTKKFISNCSNKFYWIKSVIFESHKIHSNFELRSLKHLQTLANSSVNFTV